MEKAINEIIRDLRKTKGISQQELANKVGYQSRAVISQIELGQIKVSTDKIVKFAKALEVPVSYLLGNDPTDTNGQRELICDLFDSLNVVGKNLAQEYIEMLLQNDKYKMK